MPGPLKLAILISGGGSNLQALIDACEDPGYPAEIILVISNNPEAYGLERARNAGIPAETVNHKDYSSRESFDEALHAILEQHNPDLICLAGFMRILSLGFVQKWDGKIINTHPSLLPKHGGRGMFGDHVHRAVLAAGDDESGPSIHYVTAEVDQGPVILQRRVPVQSDDTVESLRERVVAAEHLAYVEAVKMIAEKAGNPG